MMAQVDPLHLATMVTPLDLKVHLMAASSVDEVQSEVCAYVLRLIRSQLTAM